MPDTDRRLHYADFLASQASCAPRAACFDARAAFWSDDDMGWLCGWGGQPLVPWEKVGLSSQSACVVDHVDFWLWKENEHIAVSDWRQRMALPPMDDLCPEMTELHMRVCVKRWTRFSRPF
jgi:hypothetical protein